MPYHRLYVFTGKGGVGKTSLAMSLTKYLESKGQKTYYHCFHQNLNYSLTKQIKLPYFEENIENVAENYISQKLNSKLTAKWITKTPFFHSLLNMLPGLQLMMYLGKIINMLRNDPDLTIVLDGPSTGHAITLFESTYHFKKIFKTGMIVQDIKALHAFLHSPKNTKIFIMSLPSTMAVEESFELEAKLRQLNLTNISYIINNIIHLGKTIQTYDFKSLPYFLQKKINIEQLAIKSFKNQLSLTTIPQIIYSEEKNLIQKITPLTEALI